MKKTILAAGIAVFALTGIALAQQAGFTRIALQTQDLSAPGRVAGSLPRRSRADCSFLRPPAGRKR